MKNLEIAELLRSVAASYKLKDEKKNKFRIIAYERAADATEHATSELKDLWDDGKLEDVPGIGPSLAEHLGELFKTGKSKHFEEVLSGIDPRVFKLMELPKIGAKTAVKMIDELPKSEIEAKLNEVTKLRSVKKRLLLPYASEIASDIVTWMKAEPAVITIDPLGSLRRKTATVGDIDIAVATKDPVKVIERFVSYPKSSGVIEKGDKTASIALAGSIQADVMVTPPEQYGSVLAHFTGSKHHNIALRELALKKGMSINEWGITNIKTRKVTKLATEKEFYEFLGLNWIASELREDDGEIEASREGKLPKLVELSDIKADLQMHSNFAIETSHDLGESSMDELVAKANELGYSYIAMTEHNPSKSKHTSDEINTLLKRKREAVDKLNSRLGEELSYSVVNSVKDSVRKVFNSLEIDMLSGGGVPVPETGMDTVDFALVSIHTVFDLSRDEMTKRVITSLSHPKVKVFAHPTARKINEREGVELDWEKIFDFCLKNDKWIEINCDPMRLDLPDTLVREAVRAGVKMTLGTDAHHKDHMDNMIYGVNVARRGWAGPKNIVNCMSLEEFEKAVIK